MKPTALFGGGRAKRSPSTLSHSSAIQSRATRLHEERQLLHLIATVPAARDAAATAGITSDDFSDLALRITYEGIRAIEGSGRPVDQHSVGEWASDSGHITSGRLDWIALFAAFGQEWSTLATTMDPIREARRLSASVRRASLLRQTLARVSALVEEDDPAKIDAGLSHVSHAARDIITPVGVPASIARALQYTPGKAWPPPPTPHNVETILRADHRVLEDQGGLWFDERTQAPMLGIAPVTDKREARFRGRISTLYGMTARKDDVRAAVDVVACETPRNPLTEILDTYAAAWDGIPRAHSWLAHTFGCRPGETVHPPDGTPYGISAAYALRWLVAAVARAYAPGCKADTMLVLQGHQGAYKGRTLRTLAGNDSIGRGLHAEIAINLQRPRDAEQMVGAAWLVEVGELPSLLRQDADALKQFISTEKAVHVMKYERHASNLLRASVFAGTANDSELFRDPTGERRFWPVHVEHQADLGWLEEHREQIWGEAVRLYRDGVEWWLSDAEADAQAVDVARFAIHDPIREALAAHLCGPTIIREIKAGRLYTEILRLTADQWPRHRRAVAGHMQALGYRAERDGQVTVYRRR